jgi:hypothetical protein
LAFLLNQPPPTGDIIMTTFTYEAVNFNGVKGWIATRRIDGVHAGKQFGRTQRAARESFDGVTA